jgi:myo-inositol catabolism protein IolC
MTPRGYVKPLYILPFDHRGSFESGMFGWHGELTTDQAARISQAKRVIFDGFRQAVVSGLDEDTVGVLVDEQFGAAILRDAKALGYHTACPAEKSGREEFEFEYGDKFAAHIEMFEPTFCKVLVRYNPEGDSVLNRRQAARLRQVSEYLQSAGRSRFMFELLVPAEVAQLKKAHGNKNTYDREIRPALMVKTIQDLQEAGVEPDVWKVEGLDCREDCERVVQAARRDGRDRVGCIVLGRGEDERKVGEWLATAASVEGFIGFAVGRTDFWNPLVAWRDGKATRQMTVNSVAHQFEEFAVLFENARAKREKKGVMRTGTPPLYDGKDSQRRGA